MSNPPKRPLGEQISHALRDRGVEVIFGIPGVHNIELYRGIESAGITHVLARHEQGAGFMADGYARATGKPGVAYVITGPGLCNIMTPMGQAYSDSVPLLVISSCLERQDQSMGKGRLHEMIDQEGAAACVCEWSRTAPDSAGAYALIDRAFAEFVSQRPRPKHISVPIDVLAQAAAPAPAPRRAPNRPHAPAALVTEVAAKLRQAKKPLFILGGGATEAALPLRQLVEKCGAAVFPTYAGKGVIAGAYPLNFGAYLGREGSIAEIATADLVLVWGSALSEGDLWRDSLGHLAPMVRIDIDVANLSNGAPGDIAVLGDCAPFASALVQALDIHRPNSQWNSNDITRLKKGFKAACDAARPGIVPIIAAMAEVLPQETTLVSDMTQFAYVAKEVYPIEQPGRWHHPTGFGTLGYGLPAAIGAKIGLGDAPVVAIAGDYGFHYTLQELGVAVELGLSLPILLWDNGKLKEIEASMIGAQIAPNAVVARNPDFCALARAFGAAAVRPKDLAALQVELLKALKVEGPTLIHMTPDILA